MYIVNFLLYLQYIISRVDEIGRHWGLWINFYIYRGRNLRSALSEKRDVEYRKFRETLTGNADGNPEPSISLKSSDRACAETLHDKPKSF